MHKPFLGCKDALRDIFNRMRSEYDAAENKRCSTRPVDQTLRCAVWIMLSTMCRIGEMSMARWDHIDFDAGAWFTLKENVKRKLENLDVFLSGFALHHFRQLHVLTGQTARGSVIADSESGRECHSATKKIARPEDDPHGC
jgi:integrase